MSGKLTKLSKPVRRKLPQGDLVIEVRPEGLAIRRYRQTSEVFISWDRIEQTFGPPARSRSEAFRRPAPPGWLPCLGDRVWIDRRASHLSHGLVVSVIDACGGPLVSVRLAHRGNLQFAVSELRPAPA